LITFVQFDGLVDLTTTPTPLADIGSRFAPTASQLLYQDKTPELTGVETRAYNPRPAHLDFQGLPDTKVGTFPDTLWPK